jgi:hypothetical protein
VVYIKNKKHLIKILRFLLDVEDPDVIKMTLESLIESLEDDTAQPKDNDEGTI